MRDPAQEQAAYRDTLRCSAEAYASLVKVCSISSLPVYQKEMARKAMRSLAMFTMSQRAQLMGQPVVEAENIPPPAPADIAPGFRPKSRITEAVEAAGAFWESGFDLLSGPNRLPEPHRELAMDALAQVNEFVVSVWAEEDPAPPPARPSGDAVALRL
jgi:hypothetical protein